MRAAEHGARDYEGILAAEKVLKAARRPPGEFGFSRQSRPSGSDGGHIIPTTIRSARGQGLNFIDRELTTFSKNNQGIHEGIEDLRHDQRCYRSHEFSALPPAADSGADA